LSENNGDLTQDYPITKRSRHEEYATQNVDIPLHLIERQKSAINGDFNIDATVFIQAPSQCRRLIVLGLYPIANDYEGKIGSTESRMLDILDPTVFPDKKCTWVDFCVMSSNSSNKIINQRAIA